MVENEPDWTFICSGTKNARNQKYFQSSLMYQFRNPRAFNVDKTHTVIVFDPGS